MKKRKICHLSSSNFSPFPRGLKEIKTISDSKKYDMVVVAFDRSGKLPSKEIIHNVEIIRKKTPFWYKGILRPLNLLFFWSSLFIEVIKQNADIYHCSGYLTLFICVPIKIVGNKKLVYDAYEDWIYQMENRHKYLPFIIKIAERNLVRFADYVVTVDSVGDYLLKRYEKWNKNVIVLQNTPQLQVFDSRVKEDNPITSNYTDQQVVFYVGGLSKNKGIFQMLESILSVKKSIPEVKLLVAGSFPGNELEKEVREYVQKNHISDNVDFLGYTPYEQLPSILGISKIGLILYQPTSWHLRTRASSKFFLFMCASIPLVVSDFPGFRELVENENCGLLVDPNNTEQISEALILLLKNPEKAKKMGENGRKAIAERYNWETEGKKLLEVYEHLYN